MSEGGRYAALFTYLRGSGADEATFSFAEVEALIGGPLPASARASRAWWSNRASGTQAAAWMQAGYRAAVDLDGERVTFRRYRGEYRVHQVGGAIKWDGQAIRALRAHMGLNQSAFAEVLGVRQQTVSDWEHGEDRLRRSSAKHLTRVAEAAGFIYTSADEKQSD